MKKSIFAVLLYCIINTAYAQTQLKGKIIDENGKPIENANVWIESTNIGSTTNLQGEFTIRKPDTEKNIIIAKALGYKNKRIEVNSNNKIELQLKKSPLKLNEVIITGTGTFNKLKNSPVVVDVISQKELRNTNIPSFENAMIALSPSLSFTPNVMGSFMQLNGLSNKYILILVDRKKLAGDVGGNTDLSRININNIKHIEILKGSASSLYGSEAIAGVINIITEKPRENIHISTLTYYSQYGQFTQTFNADFKYKIVTSSTSFQRNQTDGWQLSDKELSKNKIIKTDKKAVNTYYSDILNQKFALKANNKLSFYLQGSLFDKKYKRPISAYKFDMKYQDYTIGAGTTYLLNEKSTVNLDFYTDNFEYIKVHTIKTKDFNSGDEELSRTQKYYDVNLRNTTHIGKYNRINGGIQHQLDYLDSKTDIKNGSRSTYTSSFYIQDEIKLLNNKLHLVPGFRYTYHETFKSRFTPKLALMYTLNNFNFRASYASGYKSPELKYLYCNTETLVKGKTTLNISNEDLKPESSNYYSLNAEYISNTITISVNSYINNISNIITRYTFTTLPTEYIGKYDIVKQYQNSSKAQIKGFDISFASTIGMGLNLGLGYSFIDSKDYDTNQPLEKTSKHTGTININWLNKWWIITSNINLATRLQCERYYSNGNARAFNLWNLSTNHTLKTFEGFIIEPGFGIENIFNFFDDKPFGSNYATLSPGRTIFISLRILYSK